MYVQLLYIDLIEECQQKGNVGCLLEFDTIVYLSLLKFSDIAMISVGGGGGRGVICNNKFPKNHDLHGTGGNRDSKSAISHFFLEILWENENQRSKFVQNQN